MVTSVHHRRWRLGAAAAGAVAAVGAAVLAFASPAAAAPSLTVTPSTGLTNGQSVTVTLSGFPANAGGINIVQCLASGTGAADCDVNDAQLGKTADASGSLTVTMPVRSTFTGLGASTPIDCTKQQCMIAANVGTSSNPNESAEANISFGSPAAAASSTPPPATTTSSAAAGGAAPVPTGANTGEAVTNGGIPVIAEVLGGIAVVLAAGSLLLHRRRMHRL
ncbi:MAG: hypothetical protein EPN43_01010 [Jatrophihabitans sp.]|nr:MAG: hypothetical protein EPN43_01010 [Jatrophihabitans sp.]